MTKENESRLLSCKNLPEFVTMFFGLGMHEKLSIFSEEITIPKGTHFFRIRRIEGIKDADDPKEWGPVPKELAKQGRFNGAFESVLYVASSPDMLEREVRLKEGEEYYLAKYVCNTAFKVGSFLGVNNQVNTLIHKIAMAVSESEDLTAEENALIDEYYKTAKGMNLWIYRCAESACPVFWKSPIRKEEIMIPKVTNAAEPPSRRRNIPGWGLLLRDIITRLTPDPIRILLA